MIKRDKYNSHTWSHLLKSELIEQSGGDKATVESICKTLFSEDSYWTVELDKEYKGATPLQRFNYLWVFPLYLVFVAPIQWLRTGHTGLRTNSKFYNLISKLTGEK